MLERNQALVGLVVLLLIGVGTFFAVSASSGAFRPGIPISAEFNDAAGLEADDFVIVAGVRAGFVEDVKIVGNIVVVDFLLDAEAIPADSSAEVFLTGALGRRAIRVIPGNSATSFVEGDVIPLTRTKTPVDIPELGDETVEVLAESNVRALSDVITALADITDGQHDNVEDILDGVQRLAAVVVDRRDDVAMVLDRGLVLVDAAADKDQQLVTIIDKFGSTLSTLVARRDDVTRLLNDTAAASNVIGDLVTDRRAQLDRVLTELAKDLQIVDAHQVDLAHVFAYVGVSFEGFASIGYQQSSVKADNPTWGNVFVTEAGEAGVGPLLECGGTLDEAFTTLLGPDPQCEGATPTATPSAFAGGGANPWRDVSGFFNVSALTGDYAEVAR